MSQDPTAPDTKVGTSPDLQKRRRGRPPKNAHVEKGNPDFKVADAKPGAIIQDEIEFDDLIQDDTPPVQMRNKVKTDIDEPVKKFDKDVVKLDKPASTIREFQDQIAVAKANGIKEIVVTSEIMSHYLKAAYPPDSGCMIFQDVFVFEEGRVDEAKAKMGMSIEQKVFGHSRAPIDHAATVRKAT